MCDQNIYSFTLTWAAQFVSATTIDWHQAISNCDSGPGFPGQKTWDAFREYVFT